MHNAFVNVDGEKMSKSKGNFVTLSGTLPTALDVRAFRYLVVSSQYRTTLGFSSKSLEGAKNTVKRLDKLRVRVMCLFCGEFGTGEKLSVGVLFVVGLMLRVTGGVFAVFDAHGSFVGSMVL